jgi:hypothetical protein
LRVDCLAELARLELALADELKAPFVDNVAAPALGACCACDAAAAGGRVCAALPCIALCIYV